MQNTNLRNILVKGGQIYNPNHEGIKDILVVGGKIVKIAEEITPPEEFEVEVVEAMDKFIVPGFIDSHVHLIGGGGESGAVSRVPELPLGEIIEAGVTTVVGLLGTDNITRSLESLLAKTKALNEFITALAYTGSYHLPPVTITGSIKKDIALIDEFVGVKFAISDHRSSQPTSKELARLASQARVGGMLANEPGLVHVHVGGGSEGLGPIWEVVEESEIPINQFVPTHMDRNSSLFQQGIEFIEEGGYIDITCPQKTIDLVPSIKKLVDGGHPLGRVTLSTDSNGSIPKFDEEGDLVHMSKGEINILPTTVTGLVQSGILALENALKLVTENPAKRLGIFNYKGSLCVGKDADIIVLSSEFDIEKVIARGVVLYNHGQVLAKDLFD